MGVIGGVARIARQLLANFMPLLRSLSVVRGGSPCYKHGAPTELLRGDEANSTSLSPGLNAAFQHERKAPASSDY